MSMIQRIVPRLPSAPCASAHKCSDQFWKYMYSAHPKARGHTSLLDYAHRGRAYRFWLGNKYYITSSSCSFFFEVCTCLRNSSEHTCTTVLNCIRPRLKFEGINHHRAVILITCSTERDRCFTMGWTTTVQQMQTELSFPKRRWALVKLR